MTRDDTNPAQDAGARPPEAGVAAPEPGRLAARLRGFGPAWLVSFLLILAGSFVFVGLNGVLVLLWRWLSRTPWSEIGYVRPKSWTRAILLGVVVGAAFKLAMKSVVMPLLGADPVNHAYHYLAGNRAAIPGFVFAIVFGAGFGEETVFRGYLFERLGRLLGKTGAARVATVVIGAALFGAAHYANQGVAGAEQATITGLVFGAVYAATGSLAGIMIAHVAFDLTAYAIIYRDLETTVAHWFFR